MSAGTPVIDGFTDMELLGRGGFSTVFAATQTDLGRRVAVKVLNFDVAPGASKRRFERECQVVGILSGVPGIVGVHRSAFTSDGRPCIVMELMSGGSLDEFVRDNGPLGAADALELASVLAGALSAAHGRGVVHRDIKPGNVLLSGDGRVALADFGIAMVAHLASSTQTVESISPPYSPPERLIAGEPDESLSDIYSLGATMHFAITGSAPFGTARDGGVSGLVFRVMNEQPPPIDRPDLPADFVRLVEQMMEKRPDLRPLTAGEVQARVQAITSAAEPAASGPPPSDAASAPPLGPTPEIDIPAPPGSSARSQIPLPVSNRPYVEMVEEQGGLWPTAVDYVRAIQDPATLVEPTLASAVIERDMLGMPISAAGQSAVVFQLAADAGSSVAVRFFTRAPLQGPARYDALAAHVALQPCAPLVPARWIAEAIVVDDIARPAVWMPWLPGRPLNLAVDDMLSDPLRIEALAHQFLGVLDDLRAADIAHGDLQNGNLLVADDLTIRLVDLDGVWVPALAGSPPDESGHRCFQHPHRVAQDWGPGVDSYSGLLIFTSLMAISADPELWRFHQGENLVLTPADLLEPGRTPAWEAMLDSPSSRVRSLTALLVEHTKAAAPLVADVHSLVERHAPVDESTARRPGHVPRPTTGAPNAAVEEKPPAQVESVGAGWWRPAEDLDEPDAPSQPVEDLESEELELVEGSSLLARLGNGPVGISLCTSVLAVLIAGGIQQVFSNAVDPAASASVWKDASNGALVLTLTMVTCGLLRSWQHLTARAWAAGARRFGIGACGGLGAGVAALFVLDVFAASVEGAGSVELNLASVAFCCFVVGAAIGIGSGGPKDPRGWVAGVAGGALGGTLSAPVFTTLGLAIGDRGELDVGSVLLPVVFMSVLLGMVVITLGVTLAHRYSARATLRVTSGPLRGRHMAVAGPTFTIGSGPANDLVVRYDASAPDSAGELVVRSDSVELATHADVVLAGGRVVRRRRSSAVDDGDSFRVGATEFELSTRGGQW